ncbi:MAG: hypothetical protein AABZ30_08805 [Myxococcota bacterium]
MTRTTARGAGETLDSAREMLAAARTLDEALGRIEGAAAGEPKGKG